MTDRLAPERRFEMEWSDPKATAQQGLSMAGLDYVAAMVRGDLPLPPICLLVGFRFTEVANGRIVMTLEPSERHYNPLGSVHGGIAATVLDSVMGCAVHSTLPKGRGYTTLEIKINYLRAMTKQTGSVRAEGKVIHTGRQTAMAEGRIVDAAGRVYAAGTTTCLLIDLAPTG